ncbi:hypothetical protein [Blastopirellula marina]|uniref:hypothetical protein n=1 Tax=Blastopirellula marina TaxID=124 RepID=UPI0011B0E5EF|nr:hypothetical protein [Blastopirellula marina]
MDNQPPPLRYTFAYEKPSPVLIMCTLGVMGQGILMAILGLGIGSNPPSAGFGFLLVAFGLILILAQYISTFRRNFFGLIVASGQLAFCSLVFFLAAIVGVVIAVPPLIVSATTVLLNLYWGVSVSEQNSLDLDSQVTNQISLFEILGAMLIFAMILGPASFFYR